MSSVNVDQVDFHNPSIQEILEASRLNKNKDILQLLGKSHPLRRKMAHPKFSSTFVLIVAIQQFIVP